MHTIEKQALPVIIDHATGEPVALIFFNKNRERVIYNLVKSDEDGIIEIFNQFQSSATPTLT